MGKDVPRINAETLSRQCRCARFRKTEKELNDIESKLKSFSPDFVIWDIEDLSKQPPWGKDISSDITDLSNYFITSNGKNIFDMFRDAISTAEEINAKIEVKSYR